jgi:purine nucleoside permease
MVAHLARQATLSDSAAAKEYRANYATEDDQYKAATLAPGVVECDVATSDVYYNGNILSSAFANTTKLLPTERAIIVPPPKRTMPSSRPFSSRPLAI